jgi:hypothetical protein
MSERTRGTITDHERNDQLVRALRLVQLLAHEALTLEQAGARLRRVGADRAAATRMSAPSRIA